MKVPEEGSRILSDFLLSTFSSLRSMAGRPSPRMDTNETRIQVARAFQPEIHSEAVLPGKDRKESRRLGWNHEWTRMDTNTGSSGFPARDLLMEAAEQTQRTRRWLTTLKFPESVICGGEAIATSPPTPLPRWRRGGIQFSVFSFQFSVFRLVPRNSGCGSGGWAVLNCVAVDECWFDDSDFPPEFSRL